MRKASLVGIAIIVAAFSCIPDDPKGNWGYYPTDQNGDGVGFVGWNDSGIGPGVIVLGDSLVVNGGVQTLADSIRFWSGRNSLVAAAGGASLSHFMKPSLIHPTKLSTVEEYSAFFQPRLMVFALGSNDARILTATEGESGGYTIDDYRSSLQGAITAALTHSQCVVLINVADHWSPTASSANVGAVNAEIAVAVVNNASRVRLADWKAYSTGHEDWFTGPNDIHHSEPTGRAAYRDFLTSTITAALASSQCTGSTCGNGLAEFGEECDGAVPTGMDCYSLNLGSGTLTCTNSCALDSSQCTGVSTCVGDYGASCGNCGGTIQCDGTCSMSDDCVPMGEWYRLTNEFLGGNRALDTYSGPVNDPFMGVTGNYSGQYWRITPLGDGYYRLTNMFLGAGRALDTYSGPVNDPFMDVTGNYSGQYWRITPLGNSAYRLTNMFLGDGRALDTYGSTPNDPFMATTGNYSGQYWHITKIP